MSRDPATILRIWGAKWVPDGDAERCMNEKCPDRKPFGLMHRRHHCRWCGRVFCDVCAPVRSQGHRRCQICYWPQCFMPCRFPIFVRKNRSVVGSPNNSHNSKDEENPFDVENRHLKGVNGYYILGKFSGSVVDNIMSFLDFKTLNALLQTCHKAQMHFHVRGLRYESSINERYPTYWNMSRIGDGGGGVVFKVRDPKASLESKDSFVALKVVRKNVQFGFAVWKRLRTEIDLQLKIDHPNIAKLLDVFQTPDEVVLVIEAGDGGSLRKVFEVLRSNHQQISWFTAHCLYQSAAALVYLRDLKIAHRDIKCDNIVLSDDFSRVMMIDFGLAELLTSDRQGFTPCGTVGFASPENIAAVAERRAKFYADIGVMHKADMFSLGVVAFMMLSSTKPFKGSRFPEMHREVQQGLRCEGRGWGHVSSAAKMLVERMLRGDATARASAEEVMQDPWVLEGCKRFKDVIARRQEDLKKQRDQLEAEFDMPTFERTTNKSGSSTAGQDGLPESEGSEGIWMLEGEQCDSAQSRFVP